MNRRAFLSGLIAAPAVIRVAPLMRIVPATEFYGTSPLMSNWHRIETGIYSNRTICKYLDLLTNPPVITYPDGTVAMFRGVPIIAREGEFPVSSHVPATSRSLVVGSFEFYAP